MKIFIQHYLSECVSRNLTVLLVNVLQEKRLETPFKGDNLNALLKTSNFEKFDLYLSEKFQKISAFAMLFLFSVTKQSLENVFGFPQ